MRIISGKFRRRNLATVPGMSTRPITSRVKERLFENILQRIEGKRVADIFAGTGTIGLEALSRGASSVLFIEKDPVAVQLLRENVEMLDCEADVLIWKTDVLRSSFRPKGERSEQFSPLETIFFDPPYKMVSGILPDKPLWRSLVRLSRDDVSVPQATLVLRVPEHTNYEIPPQWTVDWEMEMSRMKIHVCTKNTGTEPNIETEK